MTIHPHANARAEQGPVTLAAGKLSLSDRVARRTTLAFGTMLTTVAFVVYGALGAVFTREQATLLYWSNWIQLWSLPLLMVGQLVLGRAAEARNVQAFNDVEMMMHELKALHAKLEAAKETAP